jgi:hypothetical protein
LNFLVHAAQRIPRFVVIKFRNGADGAPASGGVAVLAGNGQRSVRTTRGLPLRCGHGSARCRAREQQQATHDLNGLRRKSPTLFPKCFLLLSIHRRWLGVTMQKILLTVLVLKTLYTTVPGSSSGSGALAVEGKGKQSSRPSGGNKYELHLKFQLLLAVCRRTTSCVLDVHQQCDPNAQMHRKGPAEGRVGGEPVIN